MFESTASTGTEDPVLAMHRGGKIGVRPTVDMTDRYGLPCPTHPAHSPASHR